MVKQIWENAFKAIIVASTTFVLTLLKMKVAAREPSTSPKKTMEPRSPYSVFDKPRYSLIVMAPAGMTPWSMLMNRFEYKRTAKLKLTRLLLCGAGL